MTYGHFEGEVRTEWLVQEGKEDREMVLLEDFAYIDPDGERWEAPEGRKIDGASIPQIFWSVPVGSPYVGDYRRASVVHDIACEDQNRPHPQVHKMFYNAMRCAGVPESKAQMMYFAVRWFGPKWDVAGARSKAFAGPEAVESAIDFDDLVDALDRALGETSR